VKMQARDKNPYEHGFHEFWEVALHVARNSAPEGAPLKPAEENQVIARVIEKYREGAWKFKPCPPCIAELQCKKDSGEEAFLCPVHLKQQIAEATEKWSKRDRMLA
jgi:hypothetical protein